MNGMVLLSGEEPTLALGELCGALASLGSDIRPGSIDDRAVLLPQTAPAGLARRMGLCHFSGIHMGSCGRTEKEIHQLIEECLADLDREGAISVKIVSPSGKDALSPSSLFEGFCRISKEMGFKLRHRSPDKRMFLIAGSSVHFGRILEEAGREAVKERSGSKMPFIRPIVMEPKIARALVNLSSLPTGSLILDPFMGPAGLAVEAGHLGYNVIGVEREPEILKGALMNIESQGLTSYIDAHLGDSRVLMEQNWWRDLKSIDGIVTDPPFGRSAPLMGEDPLELLTDVLATASKKLPRGGPLVLDTDNKKNLEDLDGFGILNIYPFRVHKSLTRYIGVLIKK